MPQLRSALTSRVIVEQAKGFLRESPRRLRRGGLHAAAQPTRRANGEHLTDVARRLMTDRHSRPVLVAAIAEFATASNVTTATLLPRTCAPHRLLDQPLGDDAQLDVLGLADPDEPVERLLRARRPTGCA